MTFKHVLRNQIPIESDEYDDDNDDNFYAYDDDNAQKSSTTMTSWSKYTPLSTITW